MKDNQKLVEKTFKIHDPDDEGVVPPHVFKAGLRDLSCPVVDIELFALSKILDPEDSGGIDYTNFQAGMRQPVPCSDSEEEKDLLPEDYKPKVMSSREKVAAQVFGDPYLSKYPSYVSLEMKLKDFLSIAKHPGHFCVQTETHLTVRGLINLIIECTQITSGQLRVYAGKDCTQEECLHPRLTLDECGFEGGPKHAPQKGILYYDYFVEFDDCPLLNCDFYFGNYTKPYNPVLQAFPDYQERLKKKARRGTIMDDDDI